MPACHGPSALPALSFPAVVRALGAAAVFLCLMPGAARCAGTLPFTTAVARAWAIDPVRDELITNRHMAGERADAAKSWFAGGPTLNGTYLDDHFIGSKQGYTTYQGSVSVPLWLPGQATATEKVAEAEEAAAETRLRVEHMAVAVRVLDATGAILIARRNLEIASSTASDLQRLEDLTRQGVQSGELPSSDLQAAVSEHARAQSAVGEAREKIITTEEALRQLTGSDLVPDILSWDEAAGAVALRRLPEAIARRDPRVRNARQNVLTAREGMKLARRSYMPNPEVGIDVLRQAQWESPMDTQVGAHFSVALPSDVRNAPIMTAAANRLALAGREEIQTQRNVRNEVAQVRARVDAARITLENARSSERALSERAGITEKAWRLSEMPLIEALRARQAAWEGARALNEAEVSWHAALIRLIIASGDLPGVGFL
ncbi:TolC family protein [Acetobacter sp. AN02]|uniref:TolC family protein n=1 Tax=Acetobacter sp. AN02 TaxID=2894186 RepID=UPI00243446A5|nr:TolC family protein [Acetobacter sp. AN02]MDG6093524.1 TolC family protein [Acetobacter sp. AN02]